MASLTEHVIAIRAAIKAATDEGYRVVLENGDEYEDAYVDLEQRHPITKLLVNWDSIIDNFSY